MDREEPPGDGGLAEGDRAARRASDRRGRGDLERRAPRPVSPLVAPHGGGRGKPARAGRRSRGRLALAQGPPPRHAPRGPTPWHPYPPPPRRGVQRRLPPDRRLGGEHPKATVPLLRRRAIADVEAMAPLHGTEADSLKTDYLALMADFDDFADPKRGHGTLIDRVANQAPWSTASPSAGLTSRIVPPPPLRPLYARVASFIEAEPERSRRITRMIFANWLAQADKKPADRAATVSTYPLVFGRGRRRRPLAPAGHPRPTRRDGPLLRDRPRGLRAPAGLVVLGRPVAEDLHARPPDPRRPDPLPGRPDLRDRTGSSARQRRGARRHGPAEAPRRLRPHRAAETLITIS